MIARRTGQTGREQVTEGGSEGAGQGAREERRERRSEGRTERRGRAQDSLCYRGAAYRSQHGNIILPNFPLGIELTNRYHVLLKQY